MRWASCPSVVTSGFDALVPTGRVTGTLRLWDNLWNDEYVKQYRMMDRRGTETLLLAGAYFKETIKLDVGERPLHRQVEGWQQEGRPRQDHHLPRVVAEHHDHIVPYAAAHPPMTRSARRTRKK